MKIRDGDVWQGTAGRVQRVPRRASPGRESELPAGDGERIAGQMQVSSPCRCREPAVDFAEGESAWLLGSFILSQAC